LSDDALCVAIEEMARGLVDADIGGHVLKKRVAISGQGKRGGVRTLVATRWARRWFFVYGFRKNERENVTEAELKALRELAKELLSLDDQSLIRALVAGEIVEICDGIA